MSFGMHKNDRPNYKQANDIEMELNTWRWLSHSGRDTEFRLPPSVLAPKLLHISRS
jgi:hypothetical protein